MTGVWRWWNGRRWTDDLTRASGRFDVARYRMMLWIIVLAWPVITVVYIIAAALFSLWSSWYLVPMITVVLVLVAGSIVVAVFGMRAMGRLPVPASVLNAQLGLDG